MGVPVCIDLDGVLLPAEPWLGDPDHLPVPFVGAREFMRKLGKLGVHRIIHTARTSAAFHPVDVPYYKIICRIAAHLKRYEIPYEEIWAGVGKPFAVAYIDDRAIPFRGEQDYGSTLLHLAPKLVDAPQHVYVQDLSGYHLLYASAIRAGRVVGVTSEQGVVTIRMIDR